MLIRAFQPGDGDAVVALWERCGLMAFYRRLGYVPDEAVALGKRLISD